MATQTSLLFAPLTPSLILVRPSPLRIELALSPTTACSHSTATETPTLDAPLMLFNLVLDQCKPHGVLPKSMLKET
jgi:hypothetical protein